MSRQYYPNKPKSTKTTILSGAVLVVALSSCLRPATKTCEEGLICPPDKACDRYHKQCVHPEQLEACAGRDPDAPCDYLGTSGFCDWGICHKVVCGNGFQQPGEVCDDGNTESGDGCSSDCLSAEICGNGLTDSARSEECDCGTNAINKPEFCPWVNGHLGSACTVDCRFRPPGQWVPIQAGFFDMGSPASEPGRDADEILHRVTLTHDFEIMSTEVTQDHFLQVMMYNNSEEPCGSDCPVETVSWYEAAAYCNVLSRIGGFPSCYDCVGNGPDVVCDLNTQFASPQECTGFRLPTEAEWEFAVRAGTSTANYAGNLSAPPLDCGLNPEADAIAWYCGNASDTTHPVAAKSPNPWGLYDMLGNVWEWCHDWHIAYSSDPATDPWGPDVGNERVIRGNSFINPAGAIRSADRSWIPPTDHNRATGFRVVRTLP